MNLCIPTKLKYICLAQRVVKNKKINKTELDYLYRSRRIVPSKFLWDTRDLNRIRFFVGFLARKFLRIVRLKLTSNNLAFKMFKLFHILFQETLQFFQLFLLRIRLTCRTILF